MSELRISADLALPLDAVTERIAILAKTGAGKTYTAMVLVEEMFEAGIHLAVLDPLGVGWGLRLAADGISEGLPIVIMGGPRGDLPLDPNQGTLVAGLVMKRRLSVVLDLSEFSTAEQNRFVTAFCEELFRLCSEPFHLFIDEAHRFAPKFGGDQQCLGAVTKLVGQARVRGVGLTCTTQRPARLHNDVLTQSGCLVVGRMVGPHDIGAIKDWFKYHETQAKLTEVLGSLHGLGKGDVWVLAPDLLEILARVQIRERRTYDSSATPKVGEVRRKPQQLSGLNLEELRGLLSVPEDEDGADRTERTDNGEISAESLRIVREPLQRRIAELEAEVLELRARPEPKPAVDLATWSDVCRGVGAVMMGLEALGAEVLQLSGRVQMAAIGRDPSDRMYRALPAAAVEESDGRDVGDVREPTPAAIAVETCTGSPVSPVRAIRTHTSNLARGPRRMLEALARRSPVPISRAQLGRLAKLTHSGGTFGSYISELKNKEFIQERNGQLRITEEGLAALGTSAPARPSTTRELQAWWKSSFSGAEWRVMQNLIDVHPRGLDRQELARRANLTASGGTFGAYLGVLRTAGLIEERSGKLRAVSEQLFVDGDGNGK